MSVCVCVCVSVFVLVCVGMCMSVLNEHCCSFDKDLNTFTLQAQ